MKGEKTIIIPNITLDKIEKIRNNLKNQNKKVICAGCGTEIGTMHKVNLPENKIGYICSNCKKIWEQMLKEQKK